MKVTKSKLPNEIKDMVIKHEKKEVRERKQEDRDDKKLIKKVKESK